MSDTAVIVEAVEPVVSALGLELYDVEVSGSGRGTVVRVLVDRPGGIDLDAVGAASEAISPVLDSDRVARTLPGPYALEVSSPGLERPLRKPEHFRRVVGRRVKLKTAERSKLRGEVRRADESGVTVAADGREVDIPYEQIVRGNLIDERER